MSKKRKKRDNLCNTRLLIHPELDFSQTVGNRIPVGPFYFSPVNYPYCVSGHVHPSFFILGFSQLARVPKEKTSENKKNRPRLLENQSPINYPYCVSGHVHPVCLSRLHHVRVCKWAKPISCGCVVSFHSVVASTCQCV